MSSEIDEESTRHYFRNSRAFPSRIEHLCSLCREKRVLHVGCVDAGFYERHLAERKFLHNDILAVAASVIGVDVDSRGVQRMLDDGYANIVTADITTRDGRSVVVESVRAGGGLDVIICGEVIEHVPNPLELMSGLLELSRLTGAEVVITTPNPFYWGRFVAAACRRESVHPDHNAYLSAANIETIVRKIGGAEYLHCDFYQNPSRSVFVRSVKRLISIAMPCLADGVIARVKATPNL